RRRADRDALEPGRTSPRPRDAEPRGAGVPVPPPAATVGPPVAVRAEEQRMRRTRRIGTSAYGLWLAAAAVALAHAPPAGAAGMTTHTWMAEEAVDLVETPELRALLLAHLDQVRSGAKFPDGGYFPGLIHGEEAHWQRFFDARVERLLARTDCGDLSDPEGPCAAEIAHLMGNVAHGTGDEVWDWLFEPNSPDRDEYYLHPDLSAFQDEGGQELVMDLVAIARYGVQRHA